MFLVDRRRVHHQWKCWGALDRKERGNARVLSLMKAKYGKKEDVCQE